MNKTLLILLIFSISACAIGPNYKKEVFFTDEKIVQELNLKTDSAKNISTQWFKIFGDSYLIELIETAFENSPNIKTAKEKLYQARYSLYIANAGLLPSFDASGEYVKNSPSQSVEQMGKQEYFQLGFDAAWEIDIWGGKRRLIESQNAMLKSVGSDFDNVKLVMMSEIASKYVNWQMYKSLIEKTKNNIENQLKIYETMKSKYNAGLIDEMTLKQAESLVKSTKQKLPSFVLNEKNMKNSLALLIGVLPSEIKNIKSEILEKKPNFDIKSLYDISAKTVRFRPDVYSSEQKLIAQNALIGNKMSKLLPSLSLKSFLGFQNNTLSPIFAKDYNMYSSSAQSLMPLFHWGAIINDIKTQQSATKEALYVYKLSLLQAVIDISNSMTSVEENLKNTTLAEENSSIYENIADLSKIKYDNGLIAFSDFLDDKQKAITAQIAKYQAMADFYMGIISFYKAVGGGLSANYSEQDDRTDWTTLECEPCKD